MSFDDKIIYERKEKIISVIKILRHDLTLINKNN